MTELAALFAQHAVVPLLAATKDLIILHKADGELLEWNPAFEQVKTAWPAAPNLADFFSPASREFLAELWRTSGPGSAPWQGTLELSAGDVGELLDCLLIPLPDGRFLFHAEPVIRPKPVEVSDLLVELEKTRHELERKKLDYDSVMAQVDEIAHTDLVTFVSNRRQIIGDIQRAVAACERYGKALTIFMVDIDHFKRINDTFGHAAGDEVLRLLANRLLDGIRHSDNVGRYGGEEFVVVLPETNLKSALRLANRLLKQVRALKIDIDNQAVHLTISIGIAQFRIGAETWDEFLERADKALYQAKNEGRDRYAISKVE